MIHLHDSTSSTNDLALEASSTADHGDTWVADRQTAGRGRRQVDGQRREWYSPPGSNVYMSVLLTPDVEPADATPMTLAAAAGIVDALLEVAAEHGASLDPWVKWPNDILVGERKLAGVLTEAQTDGGKLAGVVVGLGLNVNVPEENVPSHLDDVMTSTRMETGQIWDRLSLVYELRDRIVEACDVFAEHGLAPLMDDVRDRDRTHGRSVELETDEGWEEGVSRGIDDRGRLVVELDDRTVPVESGEVRFPELFELG